MDTKDIIAIVASIFMVGMFSVFIHAIIEVFKGVICKPIQFAKEIFLTIFKNQAMSEETIHSMVFILALVYCKSFEFDAMTDILRITIAPENAWGWWLAYIGTASMVYVGVDVFYNSIEKLRKALTSPSTQSIEEKKG